MHCGVRVWCRIDGKMEGENWGRMYMTCSQTDGDAALLLRSHCEGLLEVVVAKGRYW